MLTTISTRVAVPKMMTAKRATATADHAPPTSASNLLDMFASRNQTAVTQATLTLTSCPTAAPCYVQVASAPLTVGTDMMTTTVPLATFGNTSGRMNFRVGTQAFTSPTTPTPNSDWMPDTTLPPAHVP